ncbi:MAG: cell filamentation protein Fic, partial [Proteobacteria bacterium]|nr:cell filamentation protein Fic [Pseudomonadota bacterium]
MYSFKPEVLDRLTSHGISRALGFVHETRGKQDLYEQKKPEVLEALREMAIFESVESSNRLENVVVSQDILREINRIKIPINKSSRDEGEIAGYRNALDFLHQNYAKTKFDLNVVLKLHADLMQFADEGGG